MTRVDYGRKRGTDGLCRYYVALWVRGERWASCDGLTRAEADREYERLQLVAARETI